MNIGESMWNIAIVICVVPLLIWFICTINEWRCKNSASVNYVVWVNMAASGFIGAVMSGLFICYIYFGDIVIFFLIDAFSMLLHGGSGCNVYFATKLLFDYESDLMDTLKTVLLTWAYAGAFFCVFTFTIYWFGKGWEGIDLTVCAVCWFAIMASMYSIKKTMQRAMRRIQTNTNLHEDLKWAARKQENKLQFLQIFVLAAMALRLLAYQPFFPSLSAAFKPIIMVEMVVINIYWLGLYSNKSYKNVYCYSECCKGWCCFEEEPVPQLAPQLAPTAGT